MENKNEYSGNKTENNYSSDEKAKSLLRRLDDLADEYAKHLV